MQSWEGWTSCVDLRNRTKAKRKRLQEESILPNRRALTMRAPRGNTLAL